MDKADTDPTAPTARHTSADVERRIAALERRPRREWVRSLATLLAVLLAAYFAGLVLWQNRLIRQELADIRAGSRQGQFWTLCQRSATPRQRREAFIDLLGRGHTEWRSAYFQLLDLRGINLSSASLRYADFSLVDLQEARLGQVDLTNGALRVADLTGADLTDAVLNRVDATMAILTDAQLNRVQMRAGSLEQATARNARFTGADLSDANLVMADFRHADFTRASLNGAVLAGANLSGATLLMTDFSNADVVNVDFTDSNWWRARGLSPEELSGFANAFPPSETADQRLRQDFQEWLSSYREAEGE